VVPLAAWAALVLCNHLPALSTIFFITFELVSVNTNIKPAERAVKKIAKETAKSRENKCEIEGLVFSYKCHLKVHVNSHKSASAYKCVTCGNSFNDSSTLAKHAKVHTGERPYAYVVFNVTFTQFGNLKRHERKCH